MTLNSKKIPKFKVGEFVDVLRDGVWCECIIETVTINKQVLYQGYILDNAKSFAALQKHVRPAVKLRDILIQELSQEMPDLSQEKTVEKILEEEAKDAADFVNPSKRFKSMSEQELDSLEYNSKAKNTHKHTKWGVGVFTGWFYSFTQPQACIIFFKKHLQFIPAFCTVRPTPFGLFLSAIIVFF